MKEQLFQVGVKALIEDEMGRVLLLKNRDFWDMPGGRMDQGEDVRQTLERELTEEIGVNELAECSLWRVKKSVKSLSYSELTTGLLLVVYRARLPAETVPQSMEDGVQLHWVEPARAAELLRDKYPVDFCAALADIARNGDNET